MEYQKIGFSPKLLLTQQTFDTGIISTLIFGGVRILLVGQCICNTADCVGGTIKLGALIFSAMTGFFSKRMNIFFSR